MHVQQALRACTFVQVVDILRDEQQLAWPLLIEPGQRPVRGIRLDRTEPGPARIVEGVNEGRIAAIGFRRRYILDAVALPQAIGPAKRCKPALGGYARTR